MAWAVIKGSFFPFLNLGKMMFSDLKDSYNRATPLPIAKPIDHVSAFFSTIPRIIISLAAWWILFPISDAKSLSFSWTSHIIIRDLLITWIGAGIWDFLLYSDLTPIKAKMAGRKFNPKYPSWNHIFFCMFWSTISTLVSSAVEIWYLHALANNRIPLPQLDLLSISTIVWVFTLSHWRITHFYFIHRFIHPWRTQKIPDLGKFLYRHVHSLHHKSSNPSAWSGISMHPVESFLYYTVCFLPALFGAHPVVFILGKVDATLGALWGHDGYGDPGSGSFPHYLHHAHFEVNYGENLVPLDWFFGSFHDGTAKTAKAIPKSD
jgi:lathosterol oxidase